MITEVVLPAVTVENVSKTFGATRALSDLSLTVKHGSFFALLGPSGCGKTTLMRLIAGFETPDAGRVCIDGVDMAGVAPERRPVNMMFQSYALFPHMTVAGNIGYGLRRAGLSGAKLRDAIDTMIQLVQLDGLDARRPDQLSGGQRQRVALARALARRPRILLLDEPMAALDRKLREETQFALKDIQRELGTTFVVVTHDQDEAMGLADAIALLREGRIEQVGEPRSLYETPASRFVASFIGETNVLVGTVRTANSDATSIDTAEGPFLAAPRVSLEVGQRVAIAIRPERITVLREEVATSSASELNRMSGRLHDVSFRGATTLLRVRLATGALLRVALVGPPPIARASNAAVTIAVAPSDVWVLRD